MKPLFKFETPKRQKSVDKAMDRVENFIKSKFEGSAYKLSFQNVTEVGQGLVTTITHKTKKKSILVVTSLRPYGAGQSTVKVLSDYPRLNVHKNCMHLSDDNKLNVMKRVVRKYELYFLVILPKPNGDDKYWLGRYEDIPFEYWKLTYRQRKERLDRIHFPGYEDYKFKTFDGFKKELTKIFKDEN